MSFGKGARSASKQALAALNGANELPVPWWWVEVVLRQLRLAPLPQLLE